MMIRCVSHMSIAGALEKRATEGSAGIDLVAIERTELFIMQPKAVSTGLRVEIPKGYVGFVKGRSGLAFNEGIWGFEGTIDSDYRGVIKLLLVSMTKPYTIEAGTRVGQLVIVPYAQASLVASGGLETTERGEGGFGSTGQ